MVVKNSCFPGQNIVSLASGTRGIFPELSRKTTLDVNWYQVYFHYAISTGDAPSRDRFSGQWVWMSGSSTVIALYIEACTIVRTDAELTIRFEMKVGLHQGSIFSCTRVVS